MNDDKGFIEYEEPYPWPSSGTLVTKKIQLVDEDPEEFADRCAAHKGHTPLPKYLELHHVVPQTWQLFWTPDPATYPLDRDKLWDARTVPLCRTGHGNVHYWLVRLMRAYGSLKTEESLKRIWSASGTITRNQQYHSRELDIARLGMERFWRAGGKLQNLCDVHRYGGMYG